MSPNSTPDVSPDQMYVFLGNPQHRPADAHPDSPQEPEPYIASPELIQAVNLAIYVGRPLLLEGEAGCGKTRLARALAYELGLPYYPWPVRSTSKARDGLYNYDAILRLHDVQTRQLEPAPEPGAADPGATSPRKRRDPSNPVDYRQLGQLGKAFIVEDRPAVVLIDEIDKADIDFPNDLLNVLDAWEFDVPETGEPPIRAQHKPIVIITSNKEKGNLPAPFLRRCVYYFVQFPGEAQLKQIVDAHYPASAKAPPPSPELVTAAVQRFLGVREDTSLHKKPGTSEFLDWLKALHGFKPPLQEPASLSDTGPVPYRELLFKLRADWQRAT
jgi:MoxR-like ATPase